MIVVSLLSIGPECGVAESDGMKTGASISVLLPSIHTVYIQMFPETNETKLISVV